MLEGWSYRISSTTSSLTAGWLMLVSRDSASPSAKTILANAARSMDPSAATICAPKAAATAAWARPPGANTRRPSSSTSMIRAPRSARRRATALLPAPTPPVSPTIRPASGSVLPGAGGRGRPSAPGAPASPARRRHEVGDQAGQDDRAIALDRVASPLDLLHPRRRLQRSQLRLVVVVDEERPAAAHQHERGLDHRDVVPERGEVHRLAPPPAEPVVAPGPPAVLEALRVVQDAGAEGLDGPAGHRGGRRLEHRVERVVDRGPGDERDRPPLLLGHRLGPLPGGGQRVDDDGPAHELRPVGRQVDGGQAAEGHPDHRLRLRGGLRHDLGHGSGGG